LSRGELITFDPPEQPRAAFLQLEWRGMLPLGNIRYGTDLVIGRSAELSMFRLARRTDVDE
jgi:hypothetical protein